MMLIPNKKPLMVMYEENYQALARLVPDMGVDTAMLSSSRDLPDLHMNVVQRGKYTLTIAFLHALDGNEIVPDMYLTVKVYLDARVAEVLTYQNRSGFARIYTYPNNKIRYPIEKRRVNQFFSEWLAFCASKEYRFACSDET